jgi:hypothetical protein
LTYDLFVSLCALPLVALACQALPWLFRLYASWRIVPPGQIAADTSNRPLAIRDFLIGTVLVALTLSAVRFGKPTGVVEAEYWAAWGIAGAVLVAVSLLGGLLILYAMLALWNWRWSVLEVAAIWVTATVCLTVVAILLTPGGPSDRLKAFISAALVFGYVASVSGTLGLVRWYGYRLATRPG